MLAVKSDNYSLVFSKDLWQSFRDRVQESVDRSFGNPGLSRAAELVELARERHLTERERVELAELVADKGVGAELNDALSQAAWQYPTVSTQLRKVLEESVYRRPVGDVLIWGAEA